MINLNNVVPSRQAMLDAVHSPDVESAVRTAATQLRPNGQAQTRPYALTPAQLPAVSEELTRLLNEVVLVMGSYEGRQIRRNYVNVASNIKATILRLLELESGSHPSFAKQLTILQSMASASELYGTTVQMLSDRARKYFQDPSIAAELTSVFRFLMLPQTEVTLAMRMLLLAVQAPAGDIGSDTLYSSGRFTISERATSRASHAQRVNYQRPLEAVPLFIQEDDLHSLGLSTMLQTMLDVNGFRVIQAMTTMYTSISRAFVDPSLAGLAEDIASEFTAFYAGVYFKCMPLLRAFRYTEELILKYYEHLGAIEPDFKDKLNKVMCCRIDYPHVFQPPIVVIDSVEDVAGKHLVLDDIRASLGAFADWWASNVPGAPVMNGDWVNDFKHVIIWYEALVSLLQLRNAQFLEQFSTVFCAGEAVVEPVVFVSVPTAEVYDNEKHPHAGKPLVIDPTAAPTNELIADVVSRLLRRRQHVYVDHLPMTRDFDDLDVDSGAGGYATVNNRSMIMQDGSQRVSLESRLRGAPSTLSAAARTQVMLDYATYLLNEPVIVILDTFNWQGIDYMLSRETSQLSKQFVFPDFLGLPGSSYIGLHAIAEHYQHVSATDWLSPFDRYLYRGTMQLGRVVESEEGGVAVRGMYSRLLYQTLLGEWFPRTGWTDIIPATDDDTAHLNEAVHARVGLWPIWLNNVRHAPGLSVFMSRVPTYRRTGYRKVDVVHTDKPVHARSAVRTLSVSSAVESAISMVNDSIKAYVGTLLAVDHNVVTRLHVAPVIGAFRLPPAVEKLLGSGVATTASASVEAVEDQRTHDQSVTRNIIEDSAAVVSGNSVPSLDAETSKAVDAKVNDL